VKTRVLTVGGTGLEAFAGVGGPYKQGTQVVNADAIGLSLSGVEFGLALLSAQPGQSAAAGLNWTALQASATEVTVVGVPDAEIAVRNIGVAINLVSGVPASFDADRKVIDFATQNLSVVTGTGRSLALSMDGAQGQLVRATGDVTLSVSDFFHVNGSLGFEKSSTTVTLADGSEVETEVLTVGGSGLDAFVGIAGPYLLDGGSVNPDARGFGVRDVEFGLALFSAKAGQKDAASASLDGQRWTALQASVGAIDLLVGLPADLVLKPTDLSVTINQVSGSDDERRVIDFAAMPFSVVTGTGKSLLLAIDGQLGEMVRAAGHFEIAVGGFVHLNGSVAVEKSRQTLTLANDTTVVADVLTFGGTGLNAFVGITGPYRSGVDADRDGLPDDTSASAVGLTLSNTEFALALAWSREASGPAAGLQWTTLEASAGEVALVGVPSVTASASQIAVAVNLVAGVASGEDADAWVLDFSAGATALKVATGSQTGRQLGVDGSVGELLRASGDFELGVAGFFHVGGSMGFEKSSRSVALALPVVKPLGVMSVTTFAALMT
jgi:hypothetical protein